MLSVFRITLRGVPPFASGLACRVREHAHIASAIIWDYFAPPLSKLSDFVPFVSFGETSPSPLIADILCADPHNGINVRFGHRVALHGPTHSHSSDLLCSEGSLSGAAAHLISLLSTVDNCEAPLCGHQILLMLHCSL